MFPHLDPGIEFAPVVKTGNDDAAILAAVLGRQLVFREVVLTVVCFCFEFCRFRRLERHVVGEQLKAGFLSLNEPDVEGFIAFSLSVQNRRKSRAGYSLEHHLDALFTAREIKFTRGAETENRNKPDFLFPGATEYRSTEFPSARLTMLGAKSTCKDRWRQVLSEAQKIPHKHLLTLEPGISENQTDEMKAKELQLVLPASLHETYREKQRQWLMNVRQFLELVQSRQARAP